MRRPLLFLAAMAMAGFLGTFPALAAEKSMGEVFILEPKDSATVKNPVKVVFGAENLAIVPAGTEHAHGGHHHLLIDTGLPPLGEPIPKDEHYRHFGGGQTETEIRLSPGKHSLQLLLGDHNHIPHDPPIVSKVITITVEE